MHASKNLQIVIKINKLITKNYVSGFEREIDNASCLSFTKPYCQRMVQIWSPPWAQSRIIKSLIFLESSYLACHPDQQVCVRQMLTKWKNKFDREATWSRIVYALKKTKNNSLAQEVEERFMWPPTFQTIDP